MFRDRFNKCRVLELANHSQLKLVKLNTLQTERQILILAVFQHLLDSIDRHSAVRYAKHLHCLHLCYEAALDSDSLVRNLFSTVIRNLLRENASFSLFTVECYLELSLFLTYGSGGWQVAHLSQPNRCFFGRLSWPLSIITRHKEVTVFIRLLQFYD